MVRIYFSDFFDVKPEVLKEYGAFNISLVSDLPLFIDPFLLFNSTDPTYQELHAGIISYLRFLRDKAVPTNIDDGLLKAWYTFGEVKQNWLGYSTVGNKGSGLGIDFAMALHANLNKILTNFGNERITKGSHLEKLYLLSNGVGRDNISDFATNLIKEFLLEYTQQFAKDHIRQDFRKVVCVERVRFNYNTETWERGTYELPFYGGDFVLLTPRNILTKDDIWINKEDLLHNYELIASAIPNEQLRAQINNYFMLQLPSEPQPREIRKAVEQVLRKYPQILEYYIRSKEENGELAVANSNENVTETQKLFVEQIQQFVQTRLAGTRFYEKRGDTYAEALERLLYLKDQIENHDVYRIFYLNGKAIKRESDLQLQYRLVWFGTTSDVNREPNNGRGPVDYKISRGNSDKSLVEFKLASNSKLKKNLQNQVDIYERANNTNKSLKVIVFFSEEECERVKSVLRELKLDGNPGIILIDARADNKPSASTA